MNNLDKKEEEIIYKVGQGARRKTVEPVTTSLTEPLLDENGFAEGSTGSRLMRSIKALLNRRQLIQKAQDRANANALGSQTARRLGINQGKQEEDDLKGI